MNDSYVTLLGERYALPDLSEEERDMVFHLVAEAKKNPDWDTFSNYFRKRCRPVFEKLPPKDVPESPLYRIAQDLEMRLGVKQGKTRLPDYRDKLEYLIRRNYNSIAEFCRESGMDQAYLSRLFGKERNASIEKLLSILDKLGYQMQFIKRDSQPVGDI